MNKKYSSDILTKAKRYIIDNLGNIKKHGVLLIDDNGKFTIDYSLHKKYGSFIATYDYNTVGFNPVFYFESRKRKGEVKVFFFDYDSISWEIIHN